MKRNMKRNMRKGFSMIELLFVMVIMAALSAIAIPALSGGEKSAKITSLTSDSKNMINFLENEIYLNENSLTANIDEQDEQATFVYGDQFYGKDIPISQGNQIVITGKPDDCHNGYEIVVSDTTGLVTKTSTYNKCTDTAPDIQ